MKISTDWQRNNFRILLLENLLIHLSLDNRVTVHRFFLNNTAFTPVSSPRLILPIFGMCL